MECNHGKKYHKIVMVLSVNTERKLKITKASDYALRLMLSLAISNEENAISVRTISTEINIPRSFLGNIVQKLSAAGLLFTTKGAKGGLKLTRSPEDISALEVVQAVEGNLALSCCQTQESCNHTTYCSVKPLMDQLHKNITDLLANTTIQDLIEMSEGKKWGDTKILNYVI